jgi:beta propeller repeat protein
MEGCTGGTVVKRLLVHVVPFLSLRESHHLKGLRLAPLVAAALLVMVAPAWASSVQITEIPVCPGVAGSQVYPVVAGDAVVYGDGLDNTLKGFDVTTGTELFSYALTGWPNYESMSASGDYVVWSDTHPNFIYHLHLFNVKTQTDSIIAYSINCYPDVDGGLVVWSEWNGAESTVYSYNASTGDRSVLFSSPNYVEGLRISGRTVVWRDDRSGNYDIYAYNLDSQVETPVCTASGNQGSPDICGDVVAWEDYRTGNLELRGTHLTGGSEFLVAGAGGPHTSPRVTSYSIVYLNSSSGLCVYDLASGGAYGFSATAFPVPAGADGDLVAWSDNRDGMSGWDVYAARIISWNTAITLAGGAAETSRPVAVDLTAVSSDASVTDMRFSFDGSTWEPWQTVAATTSLTLAGAAGERTVWAQFRDARGNISDTVSDTIVVKVDQCSLTYALGEHGTISGEAFQMVAWGGSGTGVTAVPAEGYHFVAWSDGLKSASRTDTDVKADLSVTASFGLNEYSPAYKVQISEIPITPGVIESQCHVVVAGDVVVYQDGLDGTLKGFDARTGTQLFSHPLSGFPNASEKMAASGDYVVWSDTHPNYIYHLHLFNVKTQTDSIIAYSINCYPDIDGDLVVWSEWTGAGSTVHWYNVGTQHQGVAFFSPYDISQVRISGHTLVWQDNRSGNYDIYSYDLDRHVETPICLAPGIQATPDICGDVVAWDDWRTGDNQIRFKRLGTDGEFVIASGGGAHYHPRVTPNSIVYLNSTSRLRVYDLASGGDYGLSGTAFPEVAGADGDLVAWSDNRNGSWDVYAARVISWTTAIGLGHGSAVTSRSVAVELSAASSDADVTEMRFSFDGSTWEPWQTFAATTSLTLAGPAGERTVWAQFRDAQGNLSDVVSDSIVLDAMAPTTTAVPAGTLGNNDWYVSDVTVTLTADDNSGGSGVKAVYWKIGESGQVRTYDPNAKPQLADNTQTLYYWAEDNAGNVESPAKTCKMQIDKLAPLTSAIGLQPSAISWQNTSQSVTLPATDSPSGVAATTYRVDGVSRIYSAPFVVSGQGSHVVTYFSTDFAGNVEKSKTGYVNIDTAKPSTTASAVTAKAGTTATLSFTVNDPAPSCGAAAVTIQIVSGKKVVATISMGTRVTNEPLTYGYQVTKKGTFTYRVLATDIAGNVATSIGSAKLNVK